MAKYAQLVATGLPPGVLITIKNSSGSQVSDLFPSANATAPDNRARYADGNGALSPATYLPNGTYTVAYSGGSQSVVVSGAAGLPTTTPFDMATQTELDAQHTADAGTFPSRRAGGTSSTAAEVPMLNVRDYGAVGNGVADDTAAIQAASDAAGDVRGGVVFFPRGEYRTTTTIRLHSYVSYRGESLGEVPSAAPGTYTVLGSWIRVTNTALPAFDTDPTQYASHMSIEDLFVRIGALPDPAADTNAPGFMLYSPGNNFVMRRVQVMWAKGSGVKIALQSGTPVDPTGAGNAIFEQVFALDCGMYGIEARGTGCVVFNMCDFNRNVLGGYYLHDMVPGNQSSVTIIQQWFENSGPIGVLCENLDGTPVNIIGGTWALPTDSVVKITGATGASPNIIGAAGYGMTNWINDTVGGVNVGPSNKCTYFTDTVRGRALQVDGPAAFIRLRDRSGTTNQQQFGWGVSGNLMVLRRYNDAGASTGDVMYVNGQTGLVTLLQSVVAHQRSAQTLAANGAVTMSASTADIHPITLNANATSSSITGATSGQRLTIRWIQDATGGRTYVWPTNCKFAGGVAPSDTTAGTRTSVTFEYDGTNWIEASRAVAVA